MNKKTIFAFMIALGLAVGLAAQERSFSTLPMVQKPGVSMLTDANVKDTPQYLKALDERAAISEAYGEPGRTLETPRGEIMIYKSTIFILGPGGKLERWANYTTY
jgi:hypothetical protein